MATAPKLVPTQTPKLSMWTKGFWLETMERALKTLAQSAILGVSASKGFNLFTLDWVNFLGFAFGGAFLSFLTSIASAGVGPVGSPSLVRGDSRS